MANPLNSETAGDYTKAHRKADTDAEQQAIHHTLGKGPLQAAPGNHNHDGDYSDPAHNHDLDYSDITHNHDADYSDIAHNHDADYADIAHTHTDPVQRMIKTADESVNNSAVHQNDDHLFCSLTSGTYIFMIALHAEAGASPTPDLELGFTYSGTITWGQAGGHSPDLGATGVSASSFRSNNISNFASLLRFGVVPAGGLILIAGAISVSDSGTFRITWAQDNATAADAITLKKGSWMRVEKVS